MKNPNIAIVVSQFNEKISSTLLDSAINYLKFKFDEDYEPEIYKVFGAVEVPLACQRVLNHNKRIDAIVALGAVIRGETNHYDYVCNMVSTGCMDVMLKFNRPIGFGILTVESFDQALARTGGGKDKAVETVDAVIDFLEKIPE